MSDEKKPDAPQNAMSVLPATTPVLPAAMSVLPAAPKNAMSVLPEEPTPQWAADLAEAERAYAEKKWGQAWRKYKQLLESKDDLGGLRTDAKFLLRIGHSGSEIGSNDFDLACKTLTSAIEIDPNLADAYAYRGYIRCRFSQPWEAVSDATIAINLDPDHALAYCVRAEGFSAAGRHTAALMDIEHSLALNPNEAWTKFVHGIVRQAREEYEAALQCFESIRSENWSCTSQRIRQCTDSLEQQKKQVAALETQARDIDKKKDGTHLCSFTIPY